MIDAIINGQEYKIKRVYSGKANRCCCGCVGKYFDDDASIRKYLKKILAIGVTDEGNVYLAAQNDTRLYIAYTE
jgi:hypothetical protein